MSNGTFSIPLTKNYTMPSVADERTRSAIEDVTIPNDGFFPDINLLAVRNTMRIDGTVTQERLQHAIIEAIISVNHDLRAFRANLTAQTLADVDAPKINNESILIYRYKRAVYCRATADLYERYASYDSTNDGVKKMEQLEEIIGDLRRDALFALADINKNKRLNVELI